MNVFRLLLALTLIQLCGCGQPAIVASDTDALSTQQAGKHLPSPEWVLDGTDMFSLSEMKLAPLPRHLEGLYGAEQGGAEVKVTIKRLKDGAWEVIREHREPGLPPDKKTYRIVRKGQRAVSANNAVRIQGTTEGIIMLELNSGTESIPADFWMHYVRITKGN
jgi:hypothetical protein